MKFHPIADLFPMMPDDELRTLADNIKAEGQNEDIVADDATKLVVDGRNRFQACGMVHVGPRVVYRKFPDEAAIARFVMSKNIHRRHLTTDQRAAIGAELANMTVGRPKDEIVQSCTISLEQAAEAVHVSRRSVASAKKRMKENPEAHAAAKAGVKKPRTVKSAVRPQVQDARTAIDALVGRGEPVTRTTVKAEAGVSEVAAREAITVWQAEATRVEENKSLEHFVRVYIEKLEEILQMLKWPQFNVMKRSEFNKIRMALHSDTFQTRTLEQVTEAFNILMKYEAKMVSEEPERKLSSALPRTREELLALRKKAPNT